MPFTDIEMLSNHESLSVWTVSALLATGRHLATVDPLDARNSLSLGDYSQLSLTSSGQLKLRYHLMDIHGVRGTRATRCHVYNESLRM